MDLRIVLTDLPHRGNHAQLLHHAQVVRVLPGFDYLAINDAIGDGTRKRHRFASGTEALPRPLVGAAIGVTFYELVSLLECGRVRVVNKIDSDEFVCRPGSCGLVPLVQIFTKKTTGERLVLFY